MSGRGLRCVRLAGVGLLAAMTLATSACGMAGPVTPSAPTATPAPAPTSTPGAVDTPAPSVVATAAPSASTAPPSTTVVRDDSLLAILPPDLDGVPVTVEEASFDEAAADSAFARTVERAAFGIVVTPTDLASGVVAQLAPGTFDDAFFQDWRETYNEGACDQAGGVTTNAETELDGRTVHITTCEGGLRVYHAYVEERDVVVSLFSIGEGRFGERLMADLRP